MTVCFHQQCGMRMRGTKTSKHNMNIRDIRVLIGATGTRFWPPREINFEEKNENISKNRLKRRTFYEQITLQSSGIPVFNPQLRENDHQAWGRPQHFFANFRKLNTSEKKLIFRNWNSSTFTFDLKPLETPDHHQTCSQCRLDTLLSESIHIIHQKALCTDLGGVTGRGRCLQREK